MNDKVGLWSSVATTMSVALFAGCMAAGQDYGAYAMSMIISWAYVAMACGFSATSRADRGAVAQAGVAFGVLYAGFVTTVYFVQLTTVLHESASAEVLKALTYRELGSLMFNLDLLGYGLMSISTFFIGFTVIVRGRADRWLRLLLIAHGVFAPMCVALPILDIFAAMPRSSGDATGIAVLLFWCAYFTPVGFLAARHFASRQYPELFGRRSTTAASPT